jgi:hypothetical protein
MLGLILVVPLAYAPAAPKAADDPINSKREVGALFGTLAIDQPLEEAVPSLSARLAAVFQRRFGLEASVGSVGFDRLSEASALGVIELAGMPVLLRAGVSHVAAGGSGDHSFYGAKTGFHAGASLLSGHARDRVRWRFDYTYRQLDGPDHAFSSAGLGLVLDLGSNRHAH